MTTNTEVSKIIKEINTLDSISVVGVEKNSSIDGMT